MSSESRQGVPKENLLDAHLQELGRSLSSAREARGQSIEELAKRLRMGVEQLRALEEADRARLPEMVFVIAQARRVASNLDLCVDEQIDAIRQGGFSTIPAGTLHAPAALTPTAATPDAGSEAPAEAMAAPSPPVADAPADSPATGSAAVGDRSAEGSPEDGRAEQAAPSSQAPQAPLSPQPPQASTSGHPLRWVRSTATVALLAGVAAAGVAIWRHGLSVPVQRSTVTAAGPSGTAPPSNPIPAVPPDRLLLLTDEPSWLEVRTLEGEALHYGLFRGEQTFSNRSGLEVRAGRPDLITVKTGNAAPRPLGRIEDLNWWTIHPDGRITPLANPTEPTNRTDPTDPTEPP